MTQQPEPPIDPPARSADEDYREKCFEHMLLTQHSLRRSIANFPADGESDDRMKERLLELCSDIRGCILGWSATP